MLRKSPRIANRPRREEVEVPTTKRTRRRHRPFKSFIPNVKTPHAIEKKEKKRKARRKAYSIKLDNLILARPNNSSYFGLLQEKYAPDVFRVLLVAIFCTQTRGSSAAPVLDILFQKYPTFHHLAEADFEDVVGIIHCLGLFNIRARRIIQLSRSMILQPPTYGMKYVKKGVKYPPTSVSHLPGIGPYALDSFRLFCPQLAGVDEWRNVRPSDKELLAYVRWKWSLEGIDYDLLPPPVVEFLPPMLPTSISEDE